MYRCIPPPRKGPLWQPRTRTIELDGEYWTCLSDISEQMGFLPAEQGYSYVRRAADTDNVATFPVFETGQRNPWKRLLFVSPVGLERLLRDLKENAAEHDERRAARDARLRRREQEEAEQRERWRQREEALKAERLALAAAFPGPTNDSPADARALAIGLREMISRTTDPKDAAFLTCVGDTMAAIRQQNVRLRSALNAIREVAEGVKED